jgi:hypothetical protein
MFDRLGVSEAVLTQAIIPNSLLMLDSVDGGIIARIPRPASRFRRQPRSAALAVLGDLPRIQGNPYVIVGHIRGARLVNLQKPWRAIRKAAGLNDVP